MYFSESSGQTMFNVKFFPLLFYLAAKKDWIFLQKYLKFRVLQFNTKTVFLFQYWGPRLEKLTFNYRRGCKRSAVDYSKRKIYSLEACVAGDTLFANIFPKKVSTKSVPPINESSLLIYNFREFNISESWSGFGCSDFCVQSVEHTRIHVR